MASIVRFAAAWISNLTAKLVYSTIEGCAFLFSKYGATVVFGAEAALLFTHCPRRALATGFQAATACIIGRGAWAFFHAAQASHKANVMKERNTSLDNATTAAGSAAQSIWDWEPPYNDQFTSGAWHVLRELVVTATQMQELYPEISTLMALPELSRPEELTSRLYYLYVASENAGVSNYNLANEKPVPDSMLESLRAMRPFANFAYDCPSDAVLSDALISRGFRLLAANYETDISSGSQAYYLAMSTTPYSSSSLASPTRTTSAIGGSEGGGSGGDSKNTGEVMLCIRGTYSPEDVFTDLLMVGVAFECEEEETPTPVVNAHSGMAKAASYLVEKFGPMLCMLRDSGMKVTLIGHSLGAGVASIVALYLKQRKYGFDSTSLQCFAFEPPACLDLSLAEACSDVVLSMVHADDIVPRMAVGPFSAFLKEVARFDWQAEANKMGKSMPAPLAVMHKLAGLVGNSKVVAESASTAIQEENEKDDQATITTTEEMKKEFKKKEESKYNPFVPGKIVFVSSQPQGQHAVRVLVKPASDIIRRIRLSSSIISDHFIDTQACMLALGEDTTSL